LPVRYGNDYQYHARITPLTRSIYLPATVLAVLSGLSACATHRAAPLPGGSDLSATVPDPRVSPRQFGGYAAGSVAFNARYGLSLNDTVIRGGSLVEYLHTTAAGYVA